MNKSLTVLSKIREIYNKMRNILSDDKLFYKIISKIKEIVLNSPNFDEIPDEELDLCINILVVDAFIRCKIFESPTKGLQ